MMPSRRAVMVGTLAGLAVFPFTARAASAALTVNYSLATGRVRSFVLLDAAEARHIDGVRIGPGEGQLRFSVPGETLSKTPDVREVQALVSAATKLTPGNDRYALIDKNGDVVGAIIADPSCGDSLPDLRLVPHDFAAPGWSYDGTAFKAPPVPVKRLLP